MDTRIEKLEKWGCNTKSAMERLLDDEELYLEFLMEFTKEPSFDMLSVALEENKRDEAFEYSHMLKGVAANLSINPLYDALFSLTEHLRNDSDLTEAKSEYEKVASSFAQFGNIMAGDKV